MNGFIPKPSSRDKILRKIREVIMDDELQEQTPSNASNSRDFPLEPGASHAVLAGDIIDTDALRELGDALTMDRLRGYIDELKTDTVALLAGMPTPDAALGMVEDIHKLAGASGMIGCTKLCSTLQDLEAKIKAGNSVTADDLSFLSVVWEATDKELGAVLIAA